MDDAPVLRARLAELDPTLSSELENAVKIARNEWLPALPTNMGSSNAFPHLRNVAGYLEHIILAFEQQPESTFVPLSAGELYVALLAVLFHDYGRLDPNSQKGTPHGVLSLKHLKKSHADLGVHLCEVAALVGRIAACHEPAKSDGRGRALGKDVRVGLALSRLADTTIDPLGVIRAPLLAALLALADQMDAAYTRCVPEYLADAADGVIGLFRRHILGVYVDPSTKLVKTVLSLDSDAQKVGQNNFYDLRVHVEDDDSDHSKAKKEQASFVAELEGDGWCWDEKRALAQRSKGRRDLTSLRDASKAPVVEAIPDWLELAGAPARLDPLVSLLARRAVDLSRTERKLRKNRRTGGSELDPADRRVLLPMPDFGPQAMIFGSMKENKDLLEQVAPVLAAYGMVLDCWLVECDGRLFRHDGVQTHEPIVTQKLLTDAAQAMWSLSTGIFGSASFTYEDVAAHLGDPFIWRVKVACCRIASTAVAGAKLRALTAEVQHLDLWAGADGWHWRGRSIQHDQGRSCDYVSLKTVLEDIAGLAGPHTTPNQAPRQEEPEYTKSGVYLGYPLDQLLHRYCPTLVLTREDAEDQGKGILLTRQHTPGSGNIVIMGPPGSGKSTLGLHIAHACAARRENRCFSAYFSLECTPEETRSKAALFGWDKACRVALDLPLTDDGRAITALSDALYRVLARPKDCRLVKDNGPCTRMDCTACDSTKYESLEPRVLLMSLAPRPTTSRAEDHTAAFWSRYRQLENLLAAAFELRKKVGTGKQIVNSILPLMVIDSLNMMAEGMPNRDQLLPLFHLFRKYETTGVFLVESSTATPFDSTLADVVIRLTVKEDQGYSGRYFEVVKSRYRNQVNGRHPYKTVPQAKEGLLTPPIPRRVASLEAMAKNGVKVAAALEAAKQGDAPRCGMVVFPSVHYAVLRGFFAKREAFQERDWKGGCGEHWGIKTLSSVLPRNLTAGSVVLIEGPSGTYKTNLAATFLAKGLTCGESVLLIRLHDDQLICPIEPTVPGEPKRAKGPALSRELMDDAASSKLPLRSPWSRLACYAENQRRWQAIASDLKATITVWGYNHERQCRRTLETTPIRPAPDFPKLAEFAGVWELRKPAQLFEIDFKTGHLLAEEFVQFVREIVIRQDEDRPITRVVLDDVSEIGVAYPFLRNSETSGDILLPSLAHLMKDNHIDFVVTGTTGIHPLADEAVGRVRAVADTVLRCQYVDVFGRKHVVVEGEGQVAAVDRDDTDSTSVPAVIHNIGADENRYFDVNQSHLRGLVGFDNGRVYRPGISLQLFQEDGEVHKQYNRELLAMMRAAFASPEGLRAEHRRELDDFGQRKGAEGPTEVTLAAFDSTESEAVHDSFEIFGKAEPLDRTVVCAVDEFAESDPGSKDGRGRFVKFDPSLVLKGIEKPPADGDEARRPLFPYYKNVLLLAYHTDLLPPASAGEIGTWEQFAAAVAGIHLPFGMTPFWMDRSAPETLTCSLMDALRLSRGRIQEGESLLSFLASPPNPDQRLIELAAFSKMCLMSGAAPWDKAVLPENAAVYLCWYSQLRDLIQRYPKLAGKLAVRSLPRGGFTGDWQVGVRQGSVSAHLGRVVLTKLLSESEDYKRFAEGVGLPCRGGITRGSGVFPAWPQASAGVSLEAVLKIHEDACSRNRLVGYPEVRSVIHAAALQLVPVDKLNPWVISAIATQLIARINCLRCTETEGARFASLGGADGSDFQRR